MVFFFKQKTAYEMRISDWSSDVCSSDLACRHQRGRVQKGLGKPGQGLRHVHVAAARRYVGSVKLPHQHHEAASVRAARPATDALDLLHDAVATRSPCIAPLLCRCIRLLLILQCLDLPLTPTISRIQLGNVHGTVSTERKNT